MYSSVKRVRYARDSKVLYLDCFFSVKNRFIIECFNDGTYELRGNKTQRKTLPKEKKYFDEIKHQVEEYERIHKHMKNSTKKIDLKVQHRDMRIVTLSEIYKRKA